MSDRQSGMAKPTATNNAIPDGLASQLRSVQENAGGLRASHSGGAVATQLFSSVHRPADVAKQFNAARLIDAFFAGDLSWQGE